MVVLETIGGYESARLNFLLDNNVAVHGTDTRKVKNHDELKLLIERRQDLKQMLTQEKNRFKAPLNESLQSGIKAVIDCLN